jgi:plasmid stabilization system protein ParE
MDLARQDYSEITEYLSSFYPSTPVHFLDALEKSITVLEEHPYAYEKYEHNDSYRRIVVMEYLVFYKVKDESNTVEIHRILHGSRNIKHFLDETARS